MDQEPRSMIPESLAALPLVLQRRLLEAQYPKVPRFREDIAEALIHQDVDYAERVNDLLEIDCPLFIKYEQLELQNILQYNCVDEDSLRNVALALSILIKYGVNLLKPLVSRPQGWASVNFSNAVFRDKVDRIQGSRQILENLGYTVKSEDALCFPRNQQPHLESVSKVTTDIVVARAEIRSYLSGCHKYPRNFEELLPSGFRHLDDSNNNLSPNENNGLPEPEYPKNATTNDTSTHKNDAAGWSKQSDSTVPTSDESAAAKDGCDICGVASAEWMCALCDKKRLCTSCDDRWHSHPKRREHKRAPLQPGVENTAASVRTPGNESTYKRKGSEHAIMVIPPRTSSQVLRAEGLGEQITGSKPQDLDQTSTEGTSSASLPFLSIFDNNTMEIRVKPPVINLTSDPAEIDIGLVHCNYDSIVSDLEAMTDVGERVQRLDYYLQKLDARVKETDGKIADVIRKTAHFTIETNYLAYCFARDKLKRDHMLLQEYKENLMKQAKGSLSTVSDDMLDDQLNELKSMVRSPPPAYIPPSSGSSTYGSYHSAETGASPPVRTLDQEPAESPAPVAESPAPVAESPAPVAPPPQEPQPRPDSGGQSAHSVWSCEHCTFDNTPNTKICAMCNNTIEQPNRTPSIDPTPGHSQEAWTLINLVDEQSPADTSRQIVPGEVVQAVPKEKTEEDVASTGTTRSTEDAQVAQDAQDAQDAPLIHLEDHIDNTEQMLLQIPHHPPPEIRIPSGTSTNQDDLWSLPDAGQEADCTPSFFERVDVAKEALSSGIQNRLNEIETAKLHQELAAQSRQLIRHLKFAENSGYTVQEFDLACQKASSPDDPVAWLKTEWEALLEDFITTATARIKDEQTTYMGEFPINEAKYCLLQKDGALEEAIAFGVDQYLSKIREITDAVSDQKTLTNSLNLHKGDVEKARETVIEEHIRVLNKSIWAVSASPHEDDIYTEHNMECDEATLRDKSIPYERRVRMVLVSADLPWYKSEDVVQLLDYCDMPGDTTYDDILEAVRNVDTVEDAINFLCQDCEICYSRFPPRKILGLSSCQCKVCDGCMKLHLEVVIKERHVKDMTCPVCQLPDVQDPDEIGIHFSFLENILQVLAVSRDIYELYLKKLTEWNLMKDPHFRWCSHCGSGFIFQGDPGQKKMICPNCKKSTCYDCKKQWATQHDGISCEMFQRWKEENDPNFQAEGLKKHLEANGIDCPSCKMNYALAKGGCMHFKCTQCRHEFCCGCSQPFKTGKACKRSKQCAKAGLHCHHPRNCLYYLRDFDVKELRKLLQDHGVECSGDSSLEPRGAAGEGSKCRVMEQKETADGLIDDPCGRAAPDDYNGLCEIHFKEYLVGLINKDGIDPVEIMEIKDLKIQFERLDKTIPKQKKKEGNDAYKLRFMDLIRTEIPLPLRRTQSMASVHLI